YGATRGPRARTSLRERHRSLLGNDSDSAARRRLGGVGAGLLEHLLDGGGALSIGADQQLEVVWVAGRLERLLHGDSAGPVVVEERLVEGLHPVVATFRDRLRQP